MFQNNLNPLLAKIPSQLTFLLKPKYNNATMNYYDS